MCWDLPCGITQSMIDGIPSYCGHCGHELNDHLDDDDLIYNSDGSLYSCCNMINCECPSFGEFEYEPDMSDDDS